MKIHTFNETLQRRLKKWEFSRHNIHLMEMTIDATNKCLCGNGGKHSKQQQASDLYFEQDQLLGTLERLQNGKMQFLILRSHGAVMSLDIVYGIADERKPKNLRIFFHFPGSDLSNIFINKYFTEKDAIIYIFLPS